MIVKTTNNMDINLIQATPADLDIVNDIDNLKRVELWKKAITKNECFLVLDGTEVLGFVVFNYSFFGVGWLEMIEIRKDLRGKGIGEKTIELIIKMCKVPKIFISTNKSNTPMRKLLTKMNFTFSGELNGLDEGDPELFYYKKIDN